MTTRPGSAGRPVRVAELLLPTVLALAGRGPVSAENFLTLLASPESARAGTRVTAAPVLRAGRPAAEAVSS